MTIPAGASTWSYSLDGGSSYITTSFAATLASATTASIPLTEITYAVNQIKVYCTDQAGNRSVTQMNSVSFTVDMTSTITHFSIPNQNYLNGLTFTITPPSSKSTGAFSYTSSDTNIATVSGSIVTILKLGTITITATQEATTNYASGSATTSLIIEIPQPRILMRGLYTNNAQVFYKPNSLAPGGVGSVRNSRFKSRKT